MAAPALIADEPQTSAEAEISAGEGAGTGDRSRRKLLWGWTSIDHRVGILCRARHLLAGRTEALAAAISPELNRTRADTLVAEVLPLLAAAKFLEQQAECILKPRKLGRKGLPFWLAGVDARVDRVPLGTVLIIGPANYPLFLPGVQTLQALAAGNSVIWKPGRGGYAVARLVADALLEAGLPHDALRVTDESVDAGVEAIQSGVDKIVFTGSAAAGRAVQRLAAETSTPVIAELSGADAVFALPGTDLDRLLDALCFGMRLNGSATCMAPRRLFLVGPHPGLLSSLAERFRAMPPVRLPEPTRALLDELLADARSHGAEIAGHVEGQLAENQTQPLLILNGSPAMRLAQTDLFAPVLSVFEVATVDDAVAMAKLCPLSLTISIFGGRPADHSLRRQLNAGTILVNDLIVPTADPRVPFGGRGASGFGVTRGAEGLLEMTAVQTISVRGGKSRRHFQATTPAHEAFFTGIIQASHAGTWRERLAGVRTLMGAAKQLK